MIDDEFEGTDSVDALAEAFEARKRRRPPREPRMRPIEHSLDELRAMAGTTQTVTTYEYDSNGVTAHSQRAIVTRPITKEGNAK